ncbi:group 3 secretory phospholipase A2 [Dendrobates tinctorius]|uniref:group 3 secretory phospholipase A2 n=1 Tax=Dendrobates tinctorius TaxID=92724 RepID=UPI003CC98F5C
MFWRIFLAIEVIYLIALFTVNGDMPKSRTRRSWIMPGTEWCGVGSTAENFTSLGLFQGVDHCCREHDHCFPQIQAFEFQYGIRNCRLYTVSHCDCDQRFRRCLHNLNDTVSTFVGIMFFNILEMPCFSLGEEEQCVEWHWWRGCKTKGMVPKAELRKPESFNYSNPEDSHTPAPKLHRAGQRADLSSHTHNHTTLFPSLANNAKPRRRRLNKLQRAKAKRGSKNIIKDYTAEEKSKKQKVKSKRFLVD